MEVLQLRRTKWGSDFHRFASVKELYRFWKNFIGRNFTKIIKGMGITSKHYKDRSMLSAEEGGAENRWDNSDDDD